MKRGSWAVFALSQVCFFTGSWELFPLTVVLWVVWHTEPRLP